MRKSKLVLILLILCCSCIYAGNIQLFDAGKKAFSVGLYTIALENLNSFLDVSDGDDNEDDAVYLCGISAFYLKKYNKSLTYFQGLENDYSNSPYIKKSYYWIGLNNYNLDNYNEAISWFRKSVDASSKYKDISSLYSALSYLQVDDFDSALKIFQNVIENPEAESKYKEEALYRLSTQYLERKNPNQAINYLNKLIFDFPDSKYYSDSLSLLGESYFLLEEWNNAKRTYLLSLDNSKDGLIYKRLASVHYNLGELDESREYLEKYTDEIGYEKEIMIMHSDVLTRLGRTSDAILLTESLLEIMELTKKEIEENNYRLGTLYYKQGNFSKSYSCFLKGSTIEALYFAALSGMKSNENVHELIIRMNNLYPGDKYSLDLISRNINRLKKLNNRTEFESFLNYVLELYPDNIPYNLTYGEFLLENRELEKSLKYLSVGYKKGSDHFSNVSYKIGWIYYNKGEYSRAITYFDNIKKSDDIFQKALYSKSIAYYRVGDLENGEKGFVELLNTGSNYVEEVSFYLGMIEKDQYNYKKAIGYFNASQKKDTLYLDSLDNIAWCYYYLREYSKALEIYEDLSLKTGNELYIFNSANCYFFMEEYTNALELYMDVTEGEGSNKNSAYYKVIEILLFLKRDEEAYRWVRKFDQNSPDSDLPKEVIFTFADNKFNNNDPDGAIAALTEITEIFPDTVYTHKAQFRKAESYKLKKDFEMSSKLYLESIITDNSFFSRSVEELTSLIAEVSSPELTNSILRRLDDSDIDKSRVIPIYSEAVKQNINRESTLKDIEELMDLSKDRDEIDNLVYLKSLYYFSSDEIRKSEKSLRPLFTRSDVNDDVKIDALLLQGVIYDKKGDKKKAIDIYLNLYLNFSENIDKASFALYKGLLLTKEINDSEMTDKIYSILKNEYSETTWGKRGLNAE